METRTQFIERNMEISMRPRAQHVGEDFVFKYYNVLKKDPGSLHGFYTDESTFTSVGGDGLPFTIVSTALIHEAIMCFDYGQDLQVHIASMDCQDSLQGSVFVTVTGTMSSSSIRRRSFVQSVFLAPNTKGYFILNDVFRYVDNEMELSRISQESESHATHTARAREVDVVFEGESTLPIEIQFGDVSPGEVDSIVREMTKHLKDIHVDEPSAVFEPIQFGDVPPGEVDSIVKEMTKHLKDIHIDEPSGVCEPLSVIATPTIPVASVEKIYEETWDKSIAPKLSWSSLLKKDNGVSPVPFPAYRSVSKGAPSPSKQSTTSQTNPMIVTTSIGVKGLDKPAVVDNEFDSRSVYVKNLTSTITPSQLRNQLAKFGAVKAGKVNIRNPQEGLFYAFVEFEQSASADTAIKSSPISIEGRKIYINKKRLRARRVQGDQGQRLASRVHASTQVGNAV